MKWELVDQVANPWGTVPLTGGGRSLVPRVEDYMDRVREAAAHRDCPSRRHHYVPRAYLRAWSTDGDRVRVLDTRTGRDELQGTAATCVSKNFYRVTDRQDQPHNQVEAMLAVIDGDTALLLDHLRRWKPGDDLNFDDFITLTVAAAMQRTRTPQMRRQIETMHTWQINRASQDLATLAIDDHVDMLFRSRYEAADELSTRQLELWDDPSGRFITCDQPVLLSEDDPDEPPSTLTCQYVWWPISPHRVIAFSQELTGRKVEHHIARPAEVRALRRRYIRGAESALIGLPGDTDLPSGKVLTRRPQLVVDCETTDVASRRCRLSFGWASASGTLDRACRPLCALASANDRRP